MVRWVFLRHGESTANALGFLAGWEDVPLTALGEAQAVEAGRLLVDVPLEVAISSDLSRAVRTAELALNARGGGLPFTEVAALRERHLGDWAGMPIEALRSDGRNQTLLGWATAPPGGESHADLAARALPALARWERAGAAILVVAHGGVLRTLVGLVDGVPLEEIGQIRISNAMPMVRDLPGGTWARLATFHADLSRSRP